MFRLVVERTTEDVVVLDIPSRVGEAMVSELTVLGAVNEVELFIQTLVLQTAPFLDSRQMTWLCDSLIPCI